jgi:hypothetical protein
VKRYTEIALLILFLSSCSPQQRLQRLLKKNPQLIELDTIRVIDTVIINNYTHDTITNIHLHDSTTVINNEKVILKYFYDTLTREIWHEVQCIGDTIIKEKVVQVEKVVYKQLSWWEQYKTIILIISLIVGVLIVLKKLGKILI